MSTIQLQRFEPLFYSPLLVFQLPDVAALNQRLLVEAAAMRASSPGLERSNQNGWHSDDDFFELTEPGCMQLRGHMLEAVRQATLRVAPKYDFSAMAMQAEGWININGQGGYNTPHDHPGWVWSGCYYVRVPSIAPGEEPGRSGAIEFLDMRTNVRVLTVDDATCFMSKYTLQPSDGMLVLFPSYLRHWVYPNEQSIERVSIAFNARFVPVQKR
jgi:uncharacterized protein (TIGR02466 family)